MLEYFASEKDCRREDGNGEEECIICFEIFAIGDVLGRLECLCKFHKVRQLASIMSSGWMQTNDGSKEMHSAVVGYQGIRLLPCVSYAISHLHRRLWPVYRITRHSPKAAEMEF